MELTEYFLRVTVTSRAPAQPDAEEVRRILWGTTANPEYECPAGSYFTPFDVENGAVIFGIERSFIDDWEVISDFADVHKLTLERALERQFEREANALLDKHGLTATATLVRAEFAPDALATFDHEAVEWEKLHPGESTVNMVA